MSADGQTHYDVLGVSPYASQREVREAFLSLARRSHPSVNPDPHTHVLYDRAKAAYDAVSTYERRCAYHAQAGLLRPPRPQERKWEPEDDPTLDGPGSGQEESLLAEVISGLVSRDW